MQVNLTPDQTEIRPVGLIAEEMQAANKRLRAAQLELREATELVNKLQRQMDAAMKNIREMAPDQTTWRTA